MTFGHDALDERRAGYEEGYFRNKDAETVSKLKSVFDKKHSKEELRKLTGVEDEVMLDRLMTIIDRQELLSAFKLYPLVEIAWADGKVDAKEVQAIEAAAQKAGIRDSAAFERLGDWIRRGPNDGARAVWKLYAGQLRTKLTKAELDAFRDDLLKFANSVAESSGGFFGIFQSTSAAEQRVIDEIRTALSTG